MTRLAVLLSVLVSAMPIAAVAQEPSEAAPSPRVLHPAEVALVNETQGYVYRHFPSGLRLYTFDKDRPTKSLCDRKCAAAWPPVVAPADAQPMGLWTIVERDDGRRQWALLGRPIYVRYHDSPELAAGAGVEPGWHLVPHTAAKEDNPFQVAQR
jgi:predicted lipoprotein with Yx(FWY)xxD motif